MENKNPLNSQNKKNPLLSKSTSPINSQKVSPFGIGANKKVVKKEPVKKEISEEAKTKATVNMKFAMNEYLNDLDADKALFYLEKVEEYNPEDPHLYYNYGTVYSNKNMVDLAIKNFQKALELEPNLESARYNLGNEYCKKGRFFEALGLYESVLAVDALALDALYNAGYVCLVWLKNQPKAIEYFDKVVRLDGLNLEARFNLALAYSFGAQKDKAAEVLEELIKIVPDHYNAYYNLGCIYIDIGRKEKAMITFKKYLELDKLALSCELVFECAFIGICKK